MKQVNIRKICLLLCVAAVVLLTGCGAGEPEKKSDSDGIRIGFSFDSLVIERWQRDRDVFVSRAQELGAYRQCAECRRRCGGAKKADFVFY